MARTKKFTIDMARLRFSTMQGFAASEEAVICAGKGSFISGRFDSGVKNNEWSRLRLIVRTDEWCEYKISVYASNSGANPAPSDWERNDVCCHVENLPTLLLHGIAGQYLWFRLEVLSGAEVSGGALYTLGETFEDYLPQLYSTGRESFMHRYLSVFFTAYAELSENANDFAENLDIENAPDDFLPLISQWMGLGKLCGLLSLQELQRFLPHGQYLNRYRGTRRAVLLAASLLTEQKPVLLAQSRIHKNTASPYVKTYDKLYGGADGLIILILFDDTDTGTCMRLQRLTDMLMPVGCVSQLVVKRISAVLDGYTYLDYNAQLISESGGTVSDISIDGGFALL